MSGELKITFFSEIDDSITEKEVIEALYFEVLEPNGEVYDVKKW